jgi:2-polyprenyl-3-methyl-5-hydroxy-6-metoxy-1,4-benzoquinol methylase
VLYQLALWRVQEKLLEIIPYLDFTDRILDVGSGNCVLNQQLRIRGYNIVPFDVENLSFVEGIVPILYDGTDIPFQSDSFDMAIVITVLHHAKNPNAILLQLSKVAKRIIIIEEIY